MARPRRLPREQRRAALLAAARRLIMKRGYGELTMERAAREAGVSKALVYDHFAHRRELYLAVLAEEQVRFVQRLAPPLAHGDTEERVRAGVRAFLDLVDEYGDGYVELFRNPIAHDPELAVELGRVRDGVAGMVAGIIAGELGLSLEQSKLPAYGVVGAMETAADWLTRLAADRRPPREETDELLARLIWRGLEGVAAITSGQRARAAVVPLSPPA